jgi:hypothetical protein
MFAELLDEAMGTPAAGLDEQLRASELALRDAQARHAAVVAVIEHRGAFREVDGHRSMNAYLRATCNSSTGDAGRQRLIARVCAAAPELGDALLAGRIGVPQVLELARVHQNPRTRRFFERVVPVYLPIAEQASHDDLRLEVDRFVALADQDGAFAELFCDIENRTANVHVVGGSLHVRVTGGDPLVAEEVLKTFEWFVEREFDRDVAERAAQHGDRAVEHPLARTDAQRRFDAVVAMARAARSYGDGAKPADIVVNVVTDPHSLVDAFAEAELVVETDDGVETIELDDRVVDDVLTAAAQDPVGFTRRRCETSRGTVIHPRLLLRAALTGYVRRVVVDSQGVVVDWGRRQRFFNGPARDAATLLVTRCTHPGCTVCPEHAEVDHADEWFRDGGPTDQRNSNIECKPHNRYKTQARWRVRRDPTGRRFYQRPDGTVVLPVGARTPDFTDDDLVRAARARVAALRPTG